MWSRGQLPSPLVREEEPEDLTDDVTAPRIIGLASGSQGFGLGLLPPYFVIFPLVLGPSFTLLTLIILPAQVTVWGKEKDA